MTLVEFVPPTPHPLWELCPQMGIADVIVKVNPDLTGLADPWRYETLSSIVSRLKSAGLNVVGLEGDPFDMSPIKEFGARDCSRDEALAHYRELLASMGRLGIKLLCYNFMVGKGWSRTGVREGRGGAKATCFSLTEAAKSPDVGDRVSRSEGASPPSDGLKLTAAQVWANYEYFIKAVMPTAEKRGVRMALHPDDPCLDSLGGYARIFGSVDAYDRAYALYPSPSNAVTFCQANFKLMGADLADAARHSLIIKAILDLAHSLDKNQILIKRKPRRKLLISAEMRRTGPASAVSSAVICLAHSAEFRVGLHPFNLCNSDTGGTHLGKQRAKSLSVPHSIPPQLEQTRPGSPRGSWAEYRIPRRG